MLQMHHVLHRTYSHSPQDIQAVSHIPPQLQMPAPLWRQRVLFLPRYLRMSFSYTHIVIC